MEILDGEDGLILMIDYAASLYKDASMEVFRNTFVRVAHALVNQNSHTDISIGEIRKRNVNKKNIFETVACVFRRKK